MSEENVEVVRRFADQARERPDAVWDIFDEDVEWELDPGSLALPDVPPNSHGPDAVRHFFRRLVSGFDNWDYEVEESIDAGDAVVLRIHHWGRGKESGASVEARFWQVWTMRDGKAVRSDAQHRQDRGPRTRRAVGVGDVGEERRGGQAWAGSVGRGRP